jgi:peptide chain release factor 2
MSQGLEDVSGLLELAVEADDEETFNEAVAELDVLEEKLAQLEFRRMFSGEYDSADCYLDIQAGSGGTEAQDWASMLTRMYLRWAEARGFKTEIIEESVCLPYLRIPHPVSFMVGLRESATKCRTLSCFSSI